MALHYFPGTEVAARSGSPNEAQPLPDSAAYIRRLESRLFQLKNGNNREPLSKEMLSAMQSVREDHMNNFIQYDERNSESSFLPDGADKKLSPSYLERKIFPEKNAVTVEELQHLLEADVLSKLHSDGSSESGIDR